LSVYHIHNILKLFRTADNKEIKYLRASTLAHYYFCAIQAKLIASGVDSPPNEALAVGKKVHDAITASRLPTKHEKELEDYLKECMVAEQAGDGSTGIRGAEGIFMREISDGIHVGHVVSHGVDDFRVRPSYNAALKFGNYQFKVDEAKEVILTEYKTTNQRYVDNFKISTAIFQIKIYAWLLEPLLAKKGYYIKKLEVVYLSRAGEPIGQKEIWNYQCLSDKPEVTEILKQLSGGDFGRYIYSPEQVERDIKSIRAEFNKPLEEMIACARFKCYRCDAIFKNRCPFKGMQE
jgi:hypothetical protein